MKSSLLNSSNPVIFKLPPFFSVIYLNFSLARVIVYPERISGVSQTAANPNN